MTNSSKFSDGDWGKLLVGSKKLPAPSDGTEEFIQSSRRVLAWVQITLLVLLIVAFVLFIFSDKEDTPVIYTFYRRFHYAVDMLSYKLFRPL